MSTRPESRPHVQTVIEAIHTDAFDSWYRDRKIKQHMRDGQPWRHTPASVKPPNQHAPHRLLQCQRKAYYATQNAPKEDAQPTGVFWTGTRIEEDIVLPFLEDVAADVDDTPAYVQNSMWVDYELETDAGELQIRGSTDPVICTRQGDPILPTEVKAKQSFDGLDDENPTPADRHRAQLHAYLHGLNQTVSYPVQTGLVIYVDREHHDLRAMTVEFDHEFWTKTVCEWMATQSTYRLEGAIPPAEPEHDWECGYCSYRQRCGKGDEPYRDEPVDGFLPLVSYPREQVDRALRAEGGTETLTPALAYHYSELAAQYDVADWHCPSCSEAINWEVIDWDGDLTKPPVCPHCASNNQFATLSGPAPGTQGDSE